MTTVGTFQRRGFNSQLVWDTSQVTIDVRTFYGAEAFIAPLVWDTSQVSNMYGTFRDAEAFNQPLAWDTSKVTSMQSMFSGAESFKDDSVMRWDVSAVSASGLNEIFLDSGIMKEPCTRKFIYDAWWTDLTAKCRLKPRRILNANGFS